MTSGEGNFAQSLLGAWSDIFGGDLGAGVKPKPLQAARQRAGPARSHDGTGRQGGRRPRGRQGDGGGASVGRGLCGPSDVAQRPRGVSGAPGRTRGPSRCGVSQAAPGPRGGGARNADRSSGGARVPAGVAGTLAGAWRGPWPGPGADGATGGPCAAPRGARCHRALACWDLKCPGLRRRTRPLRFLGSSGSKAYYCFIVCKTLGSHDSPPKQAGRDASCSPYLRGRTRGQAGPGQAPLHRGPARAQLRGRRCAGRGTGREE